ncbi:MAG: hypothetical protein EOM51_00975 [Clostridia bacterium]|nr:hypothetical protein [Clostridia bacterium]
MKIKKLTASFGRLKNDTLELGDGLSIVYAPNESGKSTWCGFIKAMLYGIDSTAREKGGVKPDKVKFSPWSGAPMAGTMDIEYEGKLLTLSRKGRESAPMRDFTVNFTGTSEAARNIDHAAVGETLLGVSKDVFERSAFIGQGNISAGGSPELEKRISAIVQTGEEKSSVIEAEERLRAAIRKRRYNKSGRLPEIEKELSEIRESLSENLRESQKGEELKKAKAQALERRDTMLNKVSELRKGTRRETLEKLSQSRNRVKELESSLFERRNELAGAERKLDGEVFGRAEPEVCRAKVKDDTENLKRLEDNAKKGGSTALNYAVLALFALAAIAFELLADFNVLRISGLIGYLPRIAAGVLALAQLVRIIVIRNRRKEISSQKLEILNRYGAKTADNIVELLVTHEKNFADYLAAVKESESVSEKLENVKKEQAELDTSLLSDLDFNASGSETALAAKLLEEAELALRSIREESALWEGRQSVLKDPVEQKARLIELVKEQEKLTKEYDALTLALETLTAAGGEISHKITPQLSKRTAEIFAKLTDSRYDAVLLDRELKAAAVPQGDSIARDTAFLSTGAVDQLYLAVRLAVCELALPAEKACPIILDDALVNFDDERCAKALELLRELAAQRQIVLFTCHRREPELMKNACDVRIIEI